MPVSFTATLRATNLSTMNSNYQLLGFYNNCRNNLCYTYNHNNSYKPHTGYGRVGTSAAGYLASRKRL